VLHCILVKRSPTNKPSHFSIFFSRILQIASLMFWPVAITSILIASFAQMIYTVTHINCENALGGTAVCSMRESYRLVYFLLIGEPIADLGDEPIGAGITVLAVLFLSILLLLILSFFTMVVLAGQKWDYENMALTSFWEPKLTYLLFACRSTSGDKNLSKSETAWRIAVDILFGREGTKGTYWYACFTQKSPLVRLCFWAVTVVLVPIWLILGFASLGLLWPPQVRRFIFKPCIGDSYKPSSNTSATEFYASQVSSMRHELAQVRDMSYERSNDIQRDVRELKEILYMATAE
jgi:hypothetical protein